MGDTRDVDSGRFPSWRLNPRWSPFLEDGELPIRFRTMPSLAARYSFDETCRILGVSRVKSRIRATVFDYWSWFAAARFVRGDDDANWANG